MGAAVAGVFFQLFSGNPYVLSILGALYSIPCFYYIVTSPRLASPARFNLLTYNLICLFWWVLALSFLQGDSKVALHSYNLREQKLSVLDIALHRSIAVIIGVVWAAILARFWWPAQARRELSRSLGELSVLPVFTHQGLLTRYCSDFAWILGGFIHAWSPRTHSRPRCTARTMITMTTTTIRTAIAHYCCRIQPVLNSTTLSKNSWPCKHINIDMGQALNRLITSGSCICKFNSSNYKVCWLRHSTNLVSKGRSLWHSIDQFWPAYRLSLINCIACDVLRPEKNGQ